MRSLLIVVLITMMGTVVFAQDVLHIAGSDFPPYTSKKRLNKENPGLAVEIAKTVTEKAGLKFEMKILPWKRALTMVEKPNHAILPMSRTPERIGKYQFIGEVGPYSVYFFKLSERADIQFSTIQEATKYKIGSNSGSSRFKWLQSNGFNKLQTSPSNQLDVNKLVARRFDILLYPDLVFRNRIKEEGYLPTQFTRMLYVEELSKDGLWMALGNATSASLANKLRQAYQTVRNEGTYDALVKKYSL